VTGKSTVILVFFVSGVIFSHELRNRAKPDEAISGSNFYALSSNKIMHLPVEAEREITDHRKSVLLNGIDDEIAAVLEDLRIEENDRYNSLLEDILEETRNPSIATRIYGLWETTSYGAGLNLASNELVKVVEDADYNPAAVGAAISYLAELKHLKSQDLLVEIANSQDSRIAVSAIRAIGRMGEIADSAKTERLLDRLKTVDPFAEEDLAAALIIMLGEIHYEPASEELAAIADDAGAPPIHRKFACISVGKIGRASDYEIIERIYYEADNADLRSYALMGLSEFPNQDITPVLVQALRRDSSWRIRMAAAEKLTDLNSPGVHELLRYKIVNDPISQVRIASIKTLGRSSDQDDWNFLIEYYTDKQNPTDIRLAALRTLIENKIPGTDEAIFSIMDELWEGDEGRFLEFTCLEVSKSEWTALAPVYKRMLDSKNWIVQVYGIRGIRRSSITSLRGRVNDLDSDGIDERVRREVRFGK